MRSTRRRRSWPARFIQIAPVAALAACMSLALVSVVARGKALASVGPAVVLTSSGQAAVLAGSSGATVLASSGEATDNTWDIDDGLIRSTLVVPEGDTELAAMVAVEILVLADPELDYEIRLPASEWADGGVHALSERPVLIAKGDRRSSPDGWEIQLMPVAVGEHEIAGPVIAYSQKGTAGSATAVATRTLQLPSRTLRVVNPLDGASGAELSPMKEPLAAKPDYRRALAILLIVVAVAIVVAALLSYLRWRLRNLGQAPAPPRRPAHELAYEKLQAIEQSRLIEQGLHREFHFAISECLREYLENRYGIPALEMTTEEFLEYSRRRLDLPEICTTGAADLMRLNDLVKFAKRQSITDEMRHVFDSVRRLVDETKESDQECGKEPIEDPGNGSSERLVEESGSEHRKRPVGKSGRESGKGTGKEPGSEHGKQSSDVTEGEVTRS